jgi:hypothetical protein
MQSSTYTSTASRSGGIATRRTSVPLALVAWMVLSSAAYACAQSANEKTFASPGAAVLALYDAARNQDSQASAALFGSNANDLLHTGDAVADKNMVTNFVTHYDKMHRLVIEPNGSATLYIGAENWPFPIPIVKNNSGAWYFDTGAGKQEILFRRVGRNENDAIEILYSLVAAQRDYASQLHDGDKTQHYAMKFISDDGKQNGLYWKTGDNDAPSPIGPMLAVAEKQGYTPPQGQPEPYHGYYYRILTKQGAAAKGGARDYVVNGELTRGFAFVGYPAEYHNSGVMTFIVNQDGVVYEKDLGTDTAKIAAAMADYSPDNTWDKVD